MRDLCFVFCHGFAFDASYWHKMRAQFKSHQVICLDLGYFGSKNSYDGSVIQDSTCVVGVGHSLGFIKLLQTSIRFNYLIGLNAFCNFLGKETSLRTRRTRELALLSRQFERSPMHAMQSFYRRTGVSAFNPDWQALNVAELEKALQELALPVHYSLNIPSLIMATKNDPVVPPELVCDNFAACKPVDVEFLSTGAHGLGYVKSAYIYQRIKSFIHAN